MSSSVHGILNTFDHYTQTWKTYKGRITQYFVANDINEKSDSTGNKRKAILLSALNEGTYKLATDLVLPKNVEDVPYEDFIKLLDDHFTPKHIGFSERHNFYAAVQQAGETYSQWAARIRGLTEKCGFLNVEEALRDKFIMGMLSGPEKVKLYAKDVANLTLAEVVTMADNISCARAAAVASAAGTAGMTASTAELFKISNDGRSGSIGKVKCSACGYTNHKLSACRFANYVCRKCHVKGHLSKMCTKVNYVADYGDQGEDDTGDDESRPPRKNYNQLSSNEKLDNRQQDDIHIEEAAAVESDASSTDLDERDTRGVCPPCAHDRYNNNIRRHAHDDFSDDSDYDEALTCNVCDRSFSTRRQLADHQQKKRHFGCSACDSLFPSLMALEHHKEEFQHWSDSCCSRSDDSDDSEECNEDRHRLL